MNRSQALQYITENLNKWGDYKGIPDGWSWRIDGVLHSDEDPFLPAIGKTQWQAAQRRAGKISAEMIQVDKPPIGLTPRKLHDEQRIKAICEAVIRRASNGQLPDKEWIDELADLIEGLHDKIGDGNE